VVVFSRRSEHFSAFDAPLEIEALDLPTIVYLSPQCTDVAWKCDLRGSLEAPSEGFRGFSDAWRSRRTAPRHLDRLLLRNFTSPRQLKTIAAAAKANLKVEMKPVISGSVLLLHGERRCCGQGRGCREGTVEYSFRPAEGQFL
jgi:hypothetical protein